MKIEKDKVVSIAYELRNQDNAMIDESPVTNPLIYLQGHNNLIIGLEKALEGKTKGDKFEIKIEPAEAYGEYTDAMVQRVPKSAFDGLENFEVGMRFIAETNQGPLPVVITAVEENEVVVDGNHMLAGQPLFFKVEVVDVRDATAEELQHGHAHDGISSHHHHDHDHGHSGCTCGGHGGCSH